jgi:hypothetical protein
MRAGAGVLATALFLLLTFASGSAGATTIDTVLTPFTGADSSVHITLDDSAGDPGTIEVQVDVIGNDADLRGVFFNIALDGDLLSGIVASGDYVTGFASEDLINLGHGSNLNGGGSPCPCDFGVELGTPGISTDDLGSATFTLTLYDASGDMIDLDLDMFADQTLGVRLTSVEVDGFGREGSAKLFGTLPPIPEPTTGLLFGTGLAGLAFMGRRRTR